MEPAPPSMRTLLRNVRNPLWSAAAFYIVVYGMKEAKEILLPITLAVMMAIICSPAVRWLREHRVPNAIAVLAVVPLILAVLALIAALVGVSVSGFEAKVPTYRDRLALLVEGVFGWLSSQGIHLKVEEVIKGIDLQAAAGKASDFMIDSVSKLGGVISNTFLVGVTMILILMEGSTVPGKLRALAGDPQADISQFKRIATEVQSYLAIKTVLSLLTGVAVGVWAAILGVDFAALWGLVAFLLNYIPNIGSILAAVPAMLLALVQHGVGTSLALGAGYVVVNMVVGNVVEPMWMGRKLGLSTTVVFLSLVVWNWVWGPVGMLLSVPLTMIIKIMLQNSRDWSVIATLLDTGEAEATGEEAPASGSSEAPSDRASPAPVSARVAVSDPPQSERRPSRPISEPPATDPSPSAREPDSDGDGDAPDSSEPPAPSEPAPKSG